MQNGTVIKKNEKGFGFIKVDGAADGSKDLFFHSNDLSGVSFTELNVGDAVTFEVVQGQKGPNAKNVQRA